MSRILVSVVLAVLATACVSTTPGTVRTSGDNPLVSIEVGQLEIGGGNFYRAWYVVDRASETCWMKLGDAGSAMDCCAMRKVAAARDYITWESDASCAVVAPAAAPATPAAPGAPATP